MFPFLSDIPTRRWPVVTIAIVAINALVMLWMSKLPSQDQAIVTAKWGFVPARIGQITDQNKVVDVQMGARLVRWGWQVLQVPQVVELRSQPQQILLSALTCMFLHGGWMHLIGNMWFLIVFGNNIEDRL